MMADAVRVADMSVEDLEALVARMIDACLGTWPQQPQHIGQRSPEVWRSIVDNILELALGQPTALEMLREEREQWYKSNTW